MSAMTYQLDSVLTNPKLQTACRRASSLHKDRVEFKKQSEASGKSRSKSAGPRGSDFCAPHRAARAATRSLLAQGAIAAGEDMPQISMGCAGTWERWIRKPSISKSGHCDAGEVDVHVYYDTNIAEGEWVNAAASPIGWADQNGDSCTAFDMNLDDREAFPVLVSLHAKQVKSEAQSQLLTPEKEPQTQRRFPISDKENTEEVSKDWIVVAPEDVQRSKVSDSVFRAAFDGQHPRNMFGIKSEKRKDTTKHAPTKDDSKETQCAIDWSSAGIPTSLIKRLINGSANSAHRAPHIDKDAILVPMNVLRAQNLGSSKRERSTPKSPRSSSKSRAMKHSGGR